MTRFKDKRQHNKNSTIPQIMNYKLYLHYLRQFEIFSTEHLETKLMFTLHFHRHEENPHELPEVKAISALLKDRIATSTN